MTSKRRNAIMLQLNCCRREIRARTLEELETRVTRHERNCPVVIVVRARRRDEVAQ